MTYQPINGGFWGIIDDKGEYWRPVHCPDQLKIDGKKVTVKLREVEEGFSMFMWGTPVEVVSFST